MLSKHFNFISLGAGVQSSAMALMAAKGEIGPMPDAAIFADTQAEPARVYKWLDWLEKQLPFPVVRVSKGDLTKTALTIRDKRDGTGQWAKSLLPVFTIDQDGNRGHMQRACTYDYKVLELTKTQRRLAGVKRGQKEPTVTAWIGISIDEALRMKPSREPWVENRWPLIELGITRQDCIIWMREQGYPEPPRSACVYCPYHSDKEWLRIKTEEPEEFERAVKFERDLQAVKKQTGNMRGVPYLHRSCKPLGHVDFTNGNGGQLWISECEGMCGV